MAARAATPPPTRPQAHIGADGLKIREGDNVVWDGAPGDWRTGEASNGTKLVGKVMRFDLSNNAVVRSYGGVRERAPTAQLRKVTLPQPKDRVVWVNGDDEVKPGSIGTVLRLDPRDNAVVLFPKSPGIRSREQRRHIGAAELRIPLQLNKGDLVVYGDSIRDKGIPRGSVAEVFMMKKSGDSTVIVRFDKGMRHHAPLGLLRRPPVLAIGDSVTWDSATHEIPKGTVGVVRRFSTGATSVGVGVGVWVRFPGTRSRVPFPPGQLTKVDAAPSTAGGHEAGF